MDPSFVKMAVDGSAFFNRLSLMWEAGATLLPNSHRPSGSVLATGTRRHSSLIDLLSPEDASTSVGIDSGINHCLQPRGFSLSTWFILWLSTRIHYGTIEDSPFAFALILVSPESDVLVHSLMMIIHWYLSKLSGIDTARERTRPILVPIKL